MRIVLEVFDQSQFVRSTSCHLIKDMHLTFDMIDGCHTEADPLVGKRFIKMLGQMQSLKKLRLDDYDMHLGVASFEQTLIYDNTSLENIGSDGSSLKELNFQLEDLLHMNYFHLNLENVEKLRIEVHGEEEADEVDAMLVALSQTIQIRMPKLQFFYLDLLIGGRNSMNCILCSGQSH